MMKWNHWIVVVVLLCFLCLALKMGTDAASRAEEHERIITELKAEGAGLREEVATLKKELEPPPYTQPLPTMWVSSGTGIRTNPMGGTEEALHKGIDLVELPGMPVKAALSGRVVEHYPPPDGYYKGDPIYGSKITIDCGEGLLTVYGHFSVTYVREDDWIEAGQVIGLVGDTGVATGPHLHFEIVVDPFRYLEERRRWP